jgi:predicted histidine transporter YuiF (NhaC family)
VLFYTQIQKEDTAMEVNITALAATITALGVVFGAVFGIYRWFLKQEKQDKDIKSIKEEQSVLVHGVLACLQGLREQGCNGPVTAAIEQIENHINKQAHK